MKKNLLILITVLLNICLLNAKTLEGKKNSGFTLNKKFSKVTLKSDKDLIYSFGMSYGLAYMGWWTSLEQTIGASIGIGQIQQFKKSTKEITYNFQYLKSPKFYATGIYAQMNSYRNKKRLGFASVLMLGINYTEGKREPLCSNPGGSNPDDCKIEKFKGFFPNIAIGYGYSIMLSVNSRMFIYSVLGIKQNTFNLNLKLSF